MITWPYIICLSRIQAGKDQAKQSTQKEKDVKKVKADACQGISFNHVALRILFTDGLMISVQVVFIIRWETHYLTHPHRSWKS